MLETYPAFAAYVTCAVLLCLDLQVTWNGSGVARALTKTTPNDEDAPLFGTVLTERTPPSVARWTRAHENAVAATIPFLVLGLLYVLLGASAAVAWPLFGTFTVARRLLYSVAYVGRAVAGTMLYAIGLVATLALVVEVVRSVV